jgi:hypothetical protein
MALKAVALASTSTVLVMNVLNDGVMGWLQSFTDVCEGNKNVLPVSTTLAARTG